MQKLYDLHPYLHLVYMTSDMDTKHTNPPQIISDCFNTDTF